MQAFLSFLLVVLTTGSWLLAISYADYLVAKQERNHSKLRQRRQADLSIKRLLSLPWGWSQWVISGLLVLLFSILLVLPGPILLFIILMGGVVSFSAVLWTDAQQVRQSDADLEGWAPARPSNAGSLQIVSAKLYGLHGEYKGQILDCGHDTLIGRSHNCHVHLSKRQVSGRHARIVFSQGRWFIQDQKSKAGTFVDGMLVTAVQLQHGNKIRIANTEFEFRIE
jgi:FHA domain